MQKVLSLLPESDTLNVALLLLRCMGEYLHYSSRKLNMFRTFNIIALIISLIFVSGPLFIIGNKNYVPTMEAIITAIHVSSIS